MVNDNILKIIIIIFLNFFKKKYGFEFTFFKPLLFLSCKPNKHTMFKKVLIKRGYILIYYDL